MSQLPPSVSVGDEASMLPRPQSTDRTGREREAASFGRPASIGWAVALVAGLGVLIGIAAGSHGLKYFDYALTPYAIACVVAIGGYARRSALWLQRPPTLRLFWRAWQKSRKHGFGWRAGCGTIASIADTFLAQSFIRQRGLTRWAGHLLIAGGTALGFGLTFPLVFGWVHFETPADDATLYNAIVMGIPAGSFPVHSVRGWLAFNLLNISGAMVLLGITMAAARRLARPGEFAGQTFWEDGMPLLLLASVAATGLALTICSRVFDGKGYPVITATHLASVVVLLIYLPYGKLLHLAQRTSHLASVVVRERDPNDDAVCARCSDPFAPGGQVEDLKHVLEQLGLNIIFESSSGPVHYQDVCPRCRRAMLALSQGASLGAEKYRR